MVSSGSAAAGPGGFTSVAAEHAQVGVPALRLLDPPLPRAVGDGERRVLGRFAGAGDVLVWDEDEGDRTRASRLESHLRYYTRTLAARGQEWDNALEVVFERCHAVCAPEFADLT